MFRIFLEWIFFFNKRYFYAACSIILLLCACSETDINRGNTALKIGDYTRAIENYSKVLDYDPANRDARYGLALAYYAIAENKERIKAPSIDLWDKTVQEFAILSKIDSSHKIDGTYSASLFYLARATLLNNSNANVVSILDNSIKLDSSNYFSFNLKALIFSNSGNIEEAKKIYIYIITKEPKFSSAYLNLGNLYWSDGDVESAWDIWSMGLEVNPKDKELLHFTVMAEDSLKSLVYSGDL